MKTYKHWFWLGLQALFAFALLFGLTSPAYADIPDPKLVWAKGMGSSEGDGGDSITIDSAGNVYTLGTFTGTVDFDPGPGTVNLTSKGQKDFFISKLDTKGNLLWAKAVGGTSDEWDGDIALDGAGNVYITGYFSGVVDFDPGAGEFKLTSFGNNDIFVSKLNSSGSFVWAKQMGGDSDDRSFSIDIDNNGNVYTTGFFSETADFDPGAGTFDLNANLESIFISKLDSSGNFVWANAVGGPSFSRALSIQVDSAGAIYFAGCFWGTVDFDPGEDTYNLTSNGNEDIVVGKLDSSGALQWARAMGSSMFDDALSIAVDNDGNVYTTGVFMETVDFDPGEGVYSLVGSGGYDAFISKLNSSGNFVWAKALSGSDNELGNQIFVDDAGYAYIIGYFEETVDFNPGAGTFNLTSAGDYDGFVSKLDSDGNFLWAKTIGGPSSDSVASVAQGSDGSLYITGHFSGTADFDPGADTDNLTSAGERDIFISKLGDPDNIQVYVNQQLRGSYVVPVDGRITPRYWENGGYTGPGLQAGPVKVTSPTHDTFFTSERVHFPGTDSSKWTAFNEVMGLPTERLSTEYYFTWYDNKTMYTWVLVGNPSTTETAEVDIYIGGTLRGHYSIQPGQRVTPRYWENDGTTGPGLQAGPVRVVSTNGVKIFASERTHFTTPPWTGFNEVIGYPVEDLDSEYWFPWYDNDSMLTWVLVGNPSETETAEVDIYIGDMTTPKGHYEIGPRGKVTPRYWENGGYTGPGLVAGPVRVVCTNGVDIFASERVHFPTGNWKDFNEVMGVPLSRISNSYMFTWYDNKTMQASVLVTNTSATETASVRISIAGVDQETFDLGPRQTVTKTYADVQNGPVKVVSTNLVPIITSERVKYKNSTATSYTGFNELMGFPESDLSDEYWFTWYDNSTMVNWVLVGR